MKKSTKISLFILLATAIGIGMFILTLNAIRPKNSIKQDPSQPTKVEKTKERYERSNLTPDMVYEEIMQNSKPIDAFTYEVARAETLDPYTNPAYTIYYYEEVGEDEQMTRSLRISILEPPFEAHQQEAETTLLNTLNISKTMACKLKVTVSTTEDVDPDLGGKNLPLSFCN